MSYKMIQVGTGGHGRSWCARFLPPNVADGLIEGVAAVDIKPEALENAQKHLGLSPARCYTDIQKAFRETPADFCTIVTPPAFHEQVVDLALTYNMHILSEKPIVEDNLQSVALIFAAIESSRTGQPVRVQEFLEQTRQENWGK